MKKKKFIQVDENLIIEDNDNIIKPVYKKSNNKEDYIFEISDKDGKVAKYDVYKKISKKK